MVTGWVIYVLLVVNFAEMHRARIHAQPRGVDEMNPMHVQLIGCKSVCASYVLKINRPILPVGLTTVAMQNTSPHCADLSRGDKKRMEA